MESYLKINSSIKVKVVDYSFEREPQLGLPSYQVKVTIKAEDFFQRNLLVQVREDTLINHKPVTVSHHEFDYDGALEKIMQYEDPRFYSFHETMFGVFNIFFGTYKVNYLSISDESKNIDLID